MQVDFYIEIWQLIALYVFVGAITGRVCYILMDNDEASGVVFGLLWPIIWFATLVHGVGYYLIVFMRGNKE